ncbi:MAG: hypothetical protein WC780_08920, partial [Lentimicrobiaceae bacterium]
ILLSFGFILLSFVFILLSFVFILLSFVFILLSFVFILLSFVFFEVYELIKLNCNMIAPMKLQFKPYRHFLWLFKSNMIRICFNAIDHGWVKFISQSG